MPYLSGSPILDASGNQAQDASGNDLAEQDWDFSGLVSVLQAQQSEALGRIGEPQSTLFEYAASTSQAVIPIGGIVETIATLLEIVEALQTILGAPEGEESPLYDLTALVWNQVGGGSSPPWPVIGQQADDNATAILNAIADLSELVEGIGGGGEHPTHLLWPLLGGAGLQYHGDLAFPQQVDIADPTLVPGESRAAYLAHLIPSKTWSLWGDDDLYSFGLSGVNDSNRWVFPYTEAAWIGLGGGPDGGGGENPNFQAILDAIAALRGGEATVQGAAENGLNAIAAAEAVGDQVTTLSGDVAALRGGEATVQGVLDALNALELSVDLTDVLTAISDLRGGTATVEQVLTAVNALDLDVDLSGVLTAISDLRGGDATVEQVYNLIDALNIPTPPTTGDIAAAVWAYLVGGTASGTLLTTAATRQLPRVPPVWPGLAGVVLGTPVSLDYTVEVAGPLHGIIVDVTSPPGKLSEHPIGGETYYYRLGEISFVNDQGQAEPFQYLGFPLAVYLPRTMSVAAGAILRVQGGAGGTATPFTIP